MDDNPYQTMSIASAGPATLPKFEPKQIATKSTNDISDIDGAHSAPRYRVYTNKPQFSQADVPGATSKTLTKSRNTRDNSLYIDDIEGTRRMIKDRMMQTKRHVNPLEPEYSLPSFSPVYPPEPKFVRDAIDNSDIEGTKPRPKKEFQTRDIMSINDIEGTKPGLKHTALLNSIRTKNILEVSDISTKKDRTSRVTDPNAPSYLINGMEIRDDPLSKPRPLPAQLNNFLLQTKDISGAEAGSRYAPPFPRFEVRNTNNIADIEGAHADSIRHSITTTRMTNPLQPIYQALDPGELLLPVVLPLVPPDVIKVPTVPPRIRAKPSSTPQPPASSRGGIAVQGEGEGGFSSTLNSTWNSTADLPRTSNNNGDFDSLPFTSLPSAQDQSGREKAPLSSRRQSLLLPLANTSKGNSLPNSSRNGNANYNTSYNLPAYSSNPGSGRNGGGGSGPGSGRMGRKEREAYDSDVASVRQLQ